VSDRGARADEGWLWIRAGRAAVGGCLTFARLVTPERVIEAFGMDPADAVLLPEAQARRGLPYPDSYPGGLPGCPWIRAGRVGEWAFAIEELSTLGYSDDAGIRLSAGTEAVVVSWTATINTANYLVDGQEVTSFRPELADDRSGTDPDRFLIQMRQVGLDTGQSPDELLDAARAHELSPAGAPGDDYRDEVIAALDMFTLALGIRLPAEVASGPLLTVQRRPAGGDSKPGT
jgi:hypothetical protein